MSTDDFIPIDTLLLSRDQWRRKFVDRSTGKPSAFRGLSFVIAGAVLWAALFALIAWGAGFAWRGRRPGDLRAVAIAAAIGVSIWLAYSATPRARRLRNAFGSLRLAERSIALEEYATAASHADDAIRDYQPFVASNSSLKDLLERAQRIAALAHAEIGNVLSCMTTLRAINDPAARVEEILLMARFAPLGDRHRDELVQLTADKADLRIRVALAEVAAARGEWDRYVEQRDAAIRMARSSDRDPVAATHVALIALHAAEIGDLEGAIRASAVVRDLCAPLRIPIARQPFQAESVGDFTAVVHREAEQNAIVIARAAEQLCAGAVAALAAQDSSAAALAAGAVRLLRDRRQFALFSRTLWRWEIAAAAWAGWLARANDEPLPWRLFSLLDNLAGGIGLHEDAGRGFALQGDEEAARLLAHDTKIAMEGMGQDDVPGAAAALRRMSGLCEARRDAAGAREHAARAYEMALRADSHAIVETAIRAAEMNLARAKEILDPLVAKLDLIEDVRTRVLFLAHAASVLAAAGSIDDAVTHYRGAQSIAKRASRVDLELTIALALARLRTPADAIPDSLLTRAAALPFVPLVLLQALVARRKWREYIEQHRRLRAATGGEVARPRELEKVTGAALSGEVSVREAVAMIELARGEEPPAALPDSRLLEKERLVIASYYTADEFTLLLIHDRERAEPECIRIPIGRRSILTSMELLAEEVHEHGTWGEAIDMTWQEIVAELATPLVPHLRGDRVLCIVPHGPLHHLPFHALPHGRGFFGDLCPIVHAPSLGFLARSAAIPASWQRAVVIGDPGRQLAGAKSEVRRVAALFSVPPRLGTDAHLQLHGETIDTDILHIATHGKFDPEHPEVSGIALADEILTTEKVREMSIRARLVTLSACETGLSPADTGRQLSGFTSAFLKHDVGSVLVSLWKADDDATAELMANFYQALRGGAPLAYALNSAQRAVRARPAWKHPHYWAPFILIGRWR